MKCIGSLLNITVCFEVRDRSIRILDDIEGICWTRRKALMKYFKSIEEIRVASEEELGNVPS